jgi:hypothetical protein
VLLQPFGLFLCVSGPIGPRPAPYHPYAQELRRQHSCHCRLLLIRQSRRRRACRSSWPHRSHRRHLFRPLGLLALLTYLALLSGKHIVICHFNPRISFVDQATATIIAAIITLSGSVAATIIAVRWKSNSAPQHHVYEYRLSYPTEIARKPWIHGSSLLARTIRAVGWIVTTFLVFVGTGALLWSTAFVVGPSLLGVLEVPQRSLIVAALLSTGVLALIVGSWITRRIEVPHRPDDDDDDDD